MAGFEMRESVVHAQGPPNIRSGAQPLEEIRQPEEQDHPGSAEASSERIRESRMEERRSIPMDPENVQEEQDQVVKEMGEPEPLLDQRRRCVADYIIYRRRTPEQPSRSMAGFEMRESVVPAQGPPNIRSRAQPLEEIRQPEEQDHPGSAEASSERIREPRMEERRSLPMDPEIVQEEQDQVAIEMGEPEPLLDQRRRYVAGQPARRMDGLEMREYVVHAQGPPNIRSRAQPLEELRQPEDQEQPGSAEASRERIRIRESRMEVRRHTPWCTCNKIMAIALVVVMVLFLAFDIWLKNLGPKTSEAENCTYLDDLGKCVPWPISEEFSTL